MIISPAGIFSIKFIFIWQLFPKSLPHNDYLFPILISLSHLSKLFLNNSAAIWADRILIKLSSILLRRAIKIYYSQELRTLKNLHQHIRKNAQEAVFSRLAAITKPMVQKILRRSEIKPFKIRYYCEKRAPEFEQNMYDVLLVYKQKPWYCQYCKLSIGKHNLCVMYDYVLLCQVQFHSSKIKVFFHLKHITAFKTRAFTYTHRASHYGHPAMV